MNAHAGLPPGLPERLDALAAQGAAARAPLDWHFVTVLAQRVQTETGTLHARLAERLEQALTRLGAQLANTAPSAHATPPLTSPLALLLRDMDAAPLALAPTPSAPASGHGRDATPVAVRHTTRPHPELKSVGRMRKTLSRLKVRQQLSQALAQPPQHAGPINSQMLVLRSLALLQDISPEYLHRFMSHVDALMTLEDAQRLPAPGQALAKSGKAPHKAPSKAANTSAKR